MEEFKYLESVAKVRALFINWKTVSLALLWELHGAKRALVAERQAGRPKDGDRSWAAFVRESIESVGGPSRKTIDSYLARFEKWLEYSGGKGSEEDFQQWLKEKANVLSKEKSDDRALRPKKEKKTIEKVILCSDNTKLLVRNVIRQGKKLTFDIYLPEFDKTYSRSIYLEGSSETWPM